MEGIGLLLLGLAALAGVVCIALSYQLSKWRPCAACWRLFKPDKREVAKELIDGGFRTRCDACQWSGTPNKPSTTPNQ